MDLEMDLETAIREMLRVAVELYGGQFEPDAPIRILRERKMQTELFEKHDQEDAISNHSPKRTERQRAIDAGYDKRIQGITQKRIEEFATEVFFRPHKKFPFFEFTEAYEVEAKRRGWPQVSNPKALGSLPQKWQRRGWIKDTGQTVRRPNGNLTPVYEVIRNDRETNKTLQTS